MPFVSKRAKLEIPTEEIDYLIQRSHSRIEGAAKVHQAKILLVSPWRMVETPRL